MAVSHVGSMVRGVGFLGRLLGGAAAATSTTTTAAAASSLPLAAVAASGKFQQRTFSASSDQKEGDKSLLSKAADAVGTFLDGKVMEAKYIHPFFHENAELVGEDYNGNKYYEITKGVLYGRHRWVVYKDLYDYSPASVPPEWHGWLHNINDDAPSRVSFIVSFFFFFFF